MLNFLLYRKMTTTKSIFTFCILFLMQKINTEKAASKPKSTSASARPSQRSILAGVVRKRSANDSGEPENDKTKDCLPAKMSKANGNGDHVDAGSIKNKSDEKITSSNITTSSSTTASNTKIDLSCHDKGALKCIGILPGIGKYCDSSDSEKSTDTDDDYDFSDFDWTGRKMKKNLEDGCHE